MRSARAVFCVVCVALVAAIVLTAEAKAEDDMIRIGTYDNRGIAIAYARSAYLPVDAKRAEHETAEAAGDTVTMRAIEAEMEALQRQLHYQGFGRVPVDDLLEPVAHRLPDLAADLDLDAIVWICDYTGEGIEVVDVTMDLVRLYDPSDETLELCSQLDQYEPAKIDEIGHDH